MKRGLLRFAQDGYTMFWCPGCREPHAVVVKPGRWTWNGDVTRPTFSPSVLVYADKGTLCHSFVRDGRIDFLSDSVHALAGQTVPLTDWPGEFHDGDTDVAPPAQ